MHFCDALNTYALHEQSIRTHLKSIRSEEEDLDRLKKDRRSVGSKADSAERKLSKMTAENKNFVEQTDLLTKLREEIRTLDIQIMNEEAKLGDFKRQTSKQFLLLKFGGLLELGDKAKVSPAIAVLLSSCMVLYLANCFSCSSDRLSDSLETHYQNMFLSRRPHQAIREHTTTLTKQRPNSLATHREPSVKSHSSRRMSFQAGNHFLPLHTFKWDLPPT